MTASIWSPGSTPNLNADSSIITERFLAADQQQIFTLTNFSYVVGIGSLLVFKNGELLAPGVEALESTVSTFTINTPCAVNDEVVAVGFVGLTGTVNLVDIELIVANVAALRAYVGASTIKYARGTTADLDGGEGMFQLNVGNPPATYSDDGVNIIVPAGGDGSSAWLRQTAALIRTRLGLESISQAEAETGTATIDRIFTALRVAQSAIARINAVVTGSFIKTKYEAVSNTNAYTDAEKALLQELNVVGAVIPFALTVPTGWLVCDGQAVSRTTYATLFAYLSTTYGIGDGSTTFNLPDLRGTFVRGFNDGFTNDPDAAARTDRGDGTTGDVVGSKQADELKSHSHTVGAYNNACSCFPGERTLSQQTLAGASTDATGGNETRPINIQFIFGIKT